jgi:CPA2 family monovalent cation:H+ antiporter-2
MAKSEDGDVEYNFLELGILLLFIALAGLLASKIKFSLVPIIIVIGLLLPPNGLMVYTPSESTMAAIDFMGKLGVLFLLFSLGLEFSIRKLIASAGTILKSGVIYLAINMTASVAFLLILGWSAPAVLLGAGIIIISSSAIVAKTLVDLKRTANPETEVVLGLMLFQDIFMAVYLPVVSAIALSTGGGTSELIISVGLAFLFIIVFVFLSFKGTWIIEKIFSLANDEAFILLILALLVGMAGASEALDISEAIGALILGLVLAETTHHERIVHLIVPFRDFFGAAFFFGFALNITLDSLSGAIPIALIAVLITIAGSVTYGFIMGKVANLTRHGALNLGLTITSRGEFSIVLANLGAAAGLGAVLGSFSVLYVVLLAIIGPLLSRGSDFFYKKLAPLLGWQIALKPSKPHREIDPKLLRDDEK